MHYLTAAAIVVRVHRQVQVEEACDGYQRLQVAAAVVSQQSLAICPHLPRHSQRANTTHHKVQEAVSRSSECNVVTLQHLQCAAPVGARGECPGLGPQQT